MAKNSQTVWQGRRYAAYVTERPSETVEGQQWIENFRPEEKRTARLLLDSLQIISETTFRASLGQLLVDRVADLDKPVAFFPIRKLPKITNRKSVDPRMHPGFGLALPEEPLPLSAKYAAHPGSEGAVGNVVRDVLADHRKALRLVEASSLAELKSRRRKPRTIVLVDDFCGSGDRAAGYVEAWAQHRTIRSWHSRGLIRFHVVALAVTQQAFSCLSKNKWIEQVHALQPAADFSTAPWSRDERRDIEALCLRYGQDERMALGYERTRGLLVFQHTVPNNVPMVLWQSEAPHGDPFTPMFAGRRMTPSQQVALADYSLPVTASDIARRLRQVRLADALDRQPGFTTRFVMLTLAATARGIHGTFRLSRVLSLPIASVEAIVQACQDLDLLDSQGRLTDSGRRELRQARNRSKTSVSSHFSLRGRDEPYYPYRLRDAGGI